MKKVFKFAKSGFFLLAVVLIINILRKDFNSQELKNLIFTANYFYLILSILIVVLVIVLKGHRLKIIAEQFDINETLAECLKIQLISITFASITPGRAGEFTKIFLLAKEDKSKIPAGTIICVFERLIDVLVLVLAGIVLCIFTFNSPKIIFLLLVSAVALISSLFVMFKADFLIKKFERYIPAKVKAVIEEFENYKKKLSSKTILIFAYSTFIWLLDSIFQWSILNSIGSDNSIPIIFGINGIVSIMSILTILPMGLGTMDFSALFLYGNILKVSHEKIVFLLGSSRIFVMSTLLIMLLPTMILQKKFLSNLYNKTVKKVED